MDEGTECQTVLQAQHMLYTLQSGRQRERDKERESERHPYLEGEMEVLYVDILVRRRLALAPQQQTLLGGHLLDRNVLDGEAQNDRPDHAERHFQIAIDDLLSANGHQMDALRCNKVQRLVHIRDFVEAHFAAIGLGQRLPRDHLQQQHQLEAIAEVLLDIVDGGACFAQMTVTPRGKCLWSETDGNLDRIYTIDNDK